MKESILFEVLTPLNFSVRTTRMHWQVITTVKHPVMSGKEEIVKNTLRFPDEIRQSKSDVNVFLFYRKEGKGRWTCAVAKRLNGDGFLITAYPTDIIKEGTSVWKR